MRQPFTDRVRAAEAEIEAALRRDVHILNRLGEAILHPSTNRAEDVSRNGQDQRRGTRELSERLVTLSATQAPVASDLKLVLTMMQVVQHHGLVANQFVLIGEQLAAIAQKGGEPRATAAQAAELAALAERQLQRAVEGFTARNAALAESLARDDDRLDRLNRDICRTAQDEIGTGHREVALRHVLIARSLERIGDNAVAIARLTAELVRADVHQLAPHAATSVSEP